MGAGEEGQVESLQPVVPIGHRAKVRIGFGLCCAGLVVTLGVQLVLLFVAPSDIESLKAREAEMERALTVVGILVELFLVAGWVGLYRVPLGQRWRLTGMWLLAFGGVDFMTLSVQLWSGDKKLVAVATLVGSALGWVEMWMIAVLAAEAAEAAARSDITHQTEVTGRLILWGGCLWFAREIWLFQPQQWPPAETEPDTFGGVLGLATAVLYLFVLVRAVIFCGGLFGAYSSAIDSNQPEAPA